MVAELLTKYIWTVQTLIRAGRNGLSLNELSERWERRFDSPYSRRTFNNHRESIEEVFGICIECDRSSNRYHIKDNIGLTDGDSGSAWLINTFTVNNMLGLGKERLAGRISVEDIPSGHRHLTCIMEAMTESSMIVIRYRKYTKTETETFTLRPYAVKEFAKRWYIVAYCEEREGLRVYGLDRIVDMEIRDTKFRMPDDFDVNELFATSFGIYLPNGPGRTITFRTTPKEAHFLRDLPLHSSQQEVGSDENSVTFSIFVCPDNNLIMEFCKHGSKLEVLSPEDIRQAVAEELRQAASKY